MSAISGPQSHTPPSQNQAVCVVVGAGTGQNITTGGPNDELCLGTAIAHRFARAGYAVAVCSRSKEKLDAISRDINHALQEVKANEPAQGANASTSTAGGQQRGVVRPFAMDCTDEKSVVDAFAEIRKQFGGPIRVLAYNAAQRKFRTENVLQVSTATFENFWRVNCFGALLCARQAIPDMLAVRGEPGADPLSAAALHRGTILLTGASASLRCLAGLTSMSCGKFGLRALAQGMAREFGPQGVHVAHVIIDGAIDSPLLRSYVKGQMAKGAAGAVLAPSIPASTPFEARFLQADAIADEYFHLHAQRPSTWTQELDLRPHVEPIFSRM